MKGIVNPTTRKYDDISSYSEEQEHGETKLREQLITLEQFPVYDISIIWVLRLPFDLVLWARIHVANANWWCQL